MDVDPAASLRIWAVEVELGGRVFEIPALPAADWLPILMEVDPIKVLDLLRSSPDDPDDLDNLLLSGRITADELGQALSDTIEEVAGRSLHAALVLAVAARTSWAIVNGDLTRRGFRWDRVSLGAALDAIYLTMSERLDAKGLERFNKLIDTPMVAGRPDRAHMVAEFEAMAGPKPEGGARSTGTPSGSARSRTRQQPRQLPPVARSRGPRKPPGPHVRSAREANSGDHGDGAAPTS